MILYVDLRQLITYLCLDNCTLRTDYIPLSTPLFVTDCIPLSTAPDSYRKHYSAYAPVHTVK